MPTPAPFSTIFRLFAAAEQRTSLLPHCQPENAATEIERVVAKWTAGSPSAPRFRHRRGERLDDLRRALDAVTNALAGGGAVSRLVAARASELSLEAALVESVGTPEFPRLAAQRFPLEASTPFSCAEAEAEEWASLAEPSSDGRRIPSDDASDPASLVSVLGALAGELRLPIRITTSASMSSSAATGPGFVIVRRGVAHVPSAARRIAVHEIHAHLAPRARAVQESLGLFAVGTAGAGADEEGRALLVEERHALFDHSRKRELAFRHLAAVALRRGADFVETTRALVARGAAIRDAVTVAARAHRGGGLGREIVYLPARIRVRAAFERDPSLEAMFERGRVSIDAARILRDVSAAARDAEGTPQKNNQPNVATTGA